MNFDLTGKIAVVTGVLGKLGPTWCRTLLESGANVIAVDHPSSDKCSEFETLQNNYDNNRIRLLRGDVTDRKSLEKVRIDSEKIWDSVDIIVNNAGIDTPPNEGKNYKINEIPKDEFLPVFEVNVYGAFLVSQIFSRSMFSNQKGSIINIGSLYGNVSPDPHFYSHYDPPFVKPPAYGATKAGLNQITKFLATHWGSYGIRVNTLSPGGVEGGQDEEFKRKFCGRIPLRRMAKFDDLKGPLLFLASDASSYVTGHNLQVEGGYTAW